MVRIAALVFGGLGLLVIGFQIGLAAGQPWGHLAMGGGHAGVLPVPLRIAALVQAALFFFMGLVVFSRAGCIRTGPVHGLIWAVVALMGVSLILNLITPSAAERSLWAPVAVGLFVSALIVALKTRRG